MEMSGKIHTPAALILANISSAHSIGGCFCLQGGSETCDEEKNLLSLSTITARTIQAVARLPNRLCFRG